LQLELSTTALNKEEAQIRLDGLLLQKARLQAEAEGTDLAFPPEESKRQPALVEAERATFIARKNENTAKIAVLNAQIQQKQQIYKELRAKKRSLERNLNIIGQKVSMSAKLLAEKLTPQMDHLQLTSEYEDTKGQISSITEAIPGAYSALQEIKGRLEEEKTRVQREARTELSSVELAIARIRQTLSRAEDQQNRTTIRSPITGIIKNMRYNTIGGVVQPGEPIMDIVPLQDKLVVQARLNPIDRGYVAPGQKAVVKVLTYDYARYGGLEGTVVHVAPDSTIPDNAPPYFRVVVETNKTWLGSKKGEYPITPGMQTTVDIHTGSKTVIDYLITPILKLKHESFRER
jgi:adhesin transport system membrane fusion protein